MSNCNCLLPLSKFFQGLDFPSQAESPRSLSLSENIQMLVFTLHLQRLQGNPSADSNAWFVFSDTCSACAGWKLLPKSWLFVRSPMSESYKKGKAGVGGWKAGTKSSTPVKLVERVSDSLKNWGRKSEQWAQILPPRQLALLAFIWVHCSFLKKEMFAGKVGLTCFWEEILRPQVPQRWRAGWKQLLDGGETWLGSRLESFGGSLEQANSY